ncbi:hypothetical protein ACHHYP_20626 [Achlya hypogyna]|uniref:Uncharacterized protein n=1 Tax=Achlya hypogyna TaxID=1202772 RepID=A0A1V9YGN7_ACHHY|nr:hypothetical protein ACHHYP_20626 [Achlya hypogyna]
MFRRLAVEAKPARRCLATLARGKKASLYDTLQSRWAKTDAVAPASAAIYVTPMDQRLPAEVVIADLTASLGTFASLKRALDKAATSFAVVPDSIAADILAAVPTAATTPDEHRELLRHLVVLATNGQFHATGLLVQCLKLKAYDEALVLYTHGIDDVSDETYTVLSIMHGLTEFAPALVGGISLPKTWKLLTAYFMHHRRGLAPAVAALMAKQFPFVATPPPAVLSQVALDLIYDAEKIQFKAVHNLVRCVLHRPNWQLTPQVFITWLERNGHRPHHGVILPLLLAALSDHKLTAVDPTVVAAGLRASLVLGNWALVARFQSLAPPVDPKLRFVLDAGTPLVTSSVAAFCLRPPHAIEPDGIVDWAMALPAELQSRFVQLFGPKLLVLLGADTARFASALKFLTFAADKDGAPLGDMLEIYIEACTRFGLSPTDALALAQRSQDKLKEVPPLVLIAALEAGDFGLATELFESAESKTMDNPCHAYALEALLQAATPAARQDVHAYFLRKEPGKAMAVFQLFAAADLALPPSLLRHFCLDVIRQHDMHSFHTLLEYGMAHEIPLPADVFTVCFGTHRKEKRDPTVFVRAFVQWVALGLVEDNAIVYHAAIRACLTCDNVDVAWECVEEADSRGILLDKALLDRLVRVTDNS